MRRYECEEITMGDYKVEVEVIKSSEGKIEENYKLTPESRRKWF